MKLDNRTIRIGPEQYEPLKALSERTAIPMAEFVRSGVELILTYYGTMRRGDTFMSPDSFPRDRPGTAQDGNPSNGKAEVASRADCSASERRVIEAALVWRACDLEPSLPPTYAEALDELADTVDALLAERRAQ